nr:MAG TPA: hypothetical protein [Caudoviricetes sp.]
MDIDKPDILSYYQSDISIRHRVIIFKIVQVSYCTIATINCYIKSCIIFGNPFDGIGIDINIDAICIRIRINIHCCCLIRNSEQ